MDIDHMYQTSEKMLHIMYQMTENARVLMVIQMTSHMMQDN